MGDGRTGVEGQKGVWGSKQWCPFPLDAFPSSPPLPSSRRPYDSLYSADQQDA